MKRTILQSAIVFVCMFACYAMCAFSQNIPANDGTLRIPRTFKKQTEIPSEEAWKPMQYTEPDVDRRTGAINVNLPLLSVESGSLSMSVDLQYGSNGIKVEDDACLVGAGWHLNAGGYIMRSVVGLPDEKVGVQVNAGADIVARQNLDYLRKVLRRQKDGCYDRYSYSFGNYSGSFLIMDGQVVQTPVTDLVITPSALDENGVISFMIQTPDGNRYQFTEREKTSYDYNPSVYPTHPGYVSPDYSATTGWYLTRILSADSVDYINIDYESVPVTRRRMSDRLYSATLTVNKNNASFSVSSGGIGDMTTTTHPDKRILKTIKGRSGVLSFTSNKPTAESLYRITSITLKDSCGNEVVRNVDLSYTESADKRPLLASYEIRSGNTLLDKRSFQYYTDYSGLGTDLFGYKNSASSGDNVLRSVLDTNGQLASTRRHSFIYARGMMLKKMTGASGAYTEITYESNTCHEGNQDISVGVRVNRIVSTDPLTSRVSRRFFEYENGTTTIDFSHVTEDAFISPGGMCGNGTVVSSYTCGATMTSTSRIPGAQVENCEIYYGKVTEKQTGTFITDTLCTVYEHDVSDIKYPYVVNGGRTYTPVSDYQQDSYHYLGSHILGSTTYESQRNNRLFNPHIMYGHFREICREKAPLKKKTVMRKTASGYVPESEEEHYYSYSMEEIRNVGFYVELLTRSISYFSAAIVVSDYDNSLSCFNFMETTLQSGRIYKDSTVYRRYYPDGNVRDMHVQYLYNGRDVVVRPRYVVPGGGFRFGMEGFYESYIGPSTLHMLQAIKIRCGRSTFNKYFCYADNMNTEQFSSIKAKGMRTLPVIEKIVIDGKDSLQTTYTYDITGRSVRLAQQQILHGDAEVASQQFKSYDRVGNVLATSINNGMTTTYRWGYNNTLPVAFADGDGIFNWQATASPLYLITECSYIPLVGCTSIIYPNGRTIHNEYEGSRLKRVLGAGNALLKSYNYRLHTEGLGRGTMVEENIQTGSGTQPLCSQTYYDGFGEVSEVVAKNPSGNDILSLTKYDALGRKSSQMLPVPVTVNDASLDFGQITSAAQSFYGDLRPYSSFSYEPVAGGQVQSEAPEGTAFSSHPVTHAYLCSNNNVPYLTCRRFVMQDDNTLRADGNWNNGELDVHKVVDSDGNTAYVFTDWRGNKVLERTMLTSATSGTMADTYYVYDELGNLRFVLPPALQGMQNAGNGPWNITSNQSLKDYAYCYHYNDKLQLVEKKLPGIEPVKYVYDKTGAVILTQDGKLRTSNQWRLTLPDRFGREALDAVVTNSESMKTAIQSHWVYASRTSIAGSTLMQEGYYVPDYMTSPTILTAQYYDNYDFPSDPSFSSLIASWSSARTKSLKTGTMTTIVRNGRKLYTAYAYDNEDRVNKTISTHIMGGYDQTETDYTLDGRPTEVRKTHRKTASDTPITETITYTYDGMGRPTYQYHSLNGGTPMLLAGNTYDGVGRLTNVARGNNGSVSVGYNYNIRGWLSSITNPQFTQQLYYEQVHCGSAPQYGGNISSMSWKGTENASTQPSYNFHYDRLSRLTSAQYYLGSNYSGRFDTSYEYDIMGNITSLQRSGMQTDGTSYGVIDDLTLTYSGNQLVGVSDAAIDEPTAKDAQHFHDWANESEEYAYDANGNMTRDANSGIIFVVYDINNQPDSVRFNGTDAIRYYYDAMGNRLGSDEYALQIIPFNSPSRGVFPNFPPIVPPRPMPHQERRFCDNIIYDGSAISQILVDGGYITFDENTNEPLYHFYVQDHQGNNRVVVDANGNVEERNDYYPYGSLMSSSTISIQRFKYNGKELNQHSYMLWYDYMARQTMPILGRFSSVDPLCEKYYSISPYAFCANNPVNAIDPNGKDVLSIGPDGNIIDVEKNDDDYVQFNFYGRDGSQQILFNDEINDFELVQPVVINKSNLIYYKGCTPEGKSYDVFMVKGNEKGTELFTAFASTESEFSHVKLSGEGEKNYIASSHERLKERGMGDLIAKDEFGTRSVLEHNHNHPNQDPTPSGGFDSTKGKARTYGDLGFIDYMKKKYPNNSTQYNIYISSTKKYYNYTNY